MGALKSFQGVKKASFILNCYYLLNNIIGFASVVLLIYLIWWVWKLGFMGAIVFFVGVGTINVKILPMFFSVLNKPLAEKAKRHVLELARIGVINDSTIAILAKVPVERWPQTIANSMTDKEFKEKIWEENRQ